MTTDNTAPEGGDRIRMLTRFLDEQAEIAMFKNRDTAEYLVEIADTLEILSSQLAAAVRARDEAVAHADDLANGLHRLNEQAREVHKFSSWVGMCDYCQIADAREDATAKLQDYAARRARVDGK